MNGLKNLQSNAELHDHDVIGIMETWATKPTKLSSWEDTHNLHWIDATKQNNIGRPSGGMLILVKKILATTNCTSHTIVILHVLRNLNPKMTL